MEKTNVRRNIRNGRRWKKRIYEGTLEMEEDGKNECKKEHYKWKKME